MVITNKVAELLKIRMDRKLCECSGDMISFISSSGTGPIGVRDVLRIQTELQLYESSDFSRYKLLRDFLDGDKKWQDVEVPIAICLGFRQSLDDNLFEQTHLKPSNFLEE